MSSISSWFMCPLLRKIGLGCSYSEPAANGSTAVASAPQAAPRCHTNSMSNTEAGRTAWGNVEGVPCGRLPVAREPSRKTGFLVVPTQCSRPPKKGKHLNAIDAFQMARRVAGAKLLDPAELHALARTLKQRPELRGYGLRVHLTDEDLCRFEQTGAPRGLRFPIYPMPCGVMLAVPTLQVGELQLRVAVPLFDAKARAWANWCIESQRVRWLFDIDETHQTAMAEMLQEFPDETMVRGLIGQSRQDADIVHLARNMVSATTALVDDDAVASCVEGVEVRDVRLAIVGDFAEQFAARAVLEERAGLSSSSTLH